MEEQAFAAQAETALGRVREAMTGHVVTFSPHDRASDAALRLAAEGVAGAPVVEGGRVVGVIALGDLLAREGHLAPQTTGPFLRGERHLASLSVADVMTREVVTVGGDEPLVTAVRLMVEHGINPLPVVDEDGRVQGIIARDDVLAAVARALGSPEPARTGTHPG
jgi:CBS domain-containing protein